MKIVFDTEETLKITALNLAMNGECVKGYETQKKECTQGEKCPDCWEKKLREIGKIESKRIGVNDYLKTLKEKFKAPETMSEKYQKFSTRETS